MARAHSLRCWRVGHSRLRVERAVDRTSCHAAGTQSALIERLHDVATLRGGIRAGTRRDHRRGSVATTCSSWCQHLLPQVVEAFVEETLVLIVYVGFFFKCCDPREAAVIGPPNLVVPDLVRQRGLTVEGSDTGQLSQLLLPVVYFTLVDDARTFGQLVE